MNDIEIKNEIKKKLKEYPDVNLASEFAQEQISLDIIDTLKSKFPDIKKLFEKNSK